MGDPQFRTWPVNYREAIDKPLAGAENAVPWSVPLQAGCQARTFWGCGNAATGMFPIADGDLALRFVNDSGPCTIRFKRDDGTIRDDIRPIPEDARLALAGFQETGRTGSLLIEAPGRWGVTIVSQSAEVISKSADAGHQSVDDASPDVSFEPWMPEVEPLPDPSRLFECSRRLSANLKQLTPGDLPGSEAFEIMLPHHKWFWGDRALVVTTPGNVLMGFPVPQLELADQRSIHQFQSILPQDPPRNLAVITFTDLSALMTDPQPCIPFLGFLLGFTILGHTASVFEGHPSRLAAGCRNADILLLDSGMVPYLQADWKEVVSAEMRGNEVWIHDRDAYQLIQTTLDNLITDRDDALINFKDPPTVLGGRG